MQKLFVFFAVNLIVCCLIVLATERGTPSSVSGILENDMADTTNDSVTVPVKYDVFVPEKYWKPIKAGQAIPPGLHVRMNLQTGISEAKLMDEEEKEPAGSSLSVVPNENPPDEEKEGVSFGCLIDWFVTEWSDQWILPIDWLICFAFYFTGFYCFIRFLNSLLFSPF